MSPDWPAAVSAGFLFRALTPALPAGAAMLRLVVETPDGQVMHETPVVIAAAPLEDVAPDVMPPAYVAPAYVAPADVAPEEVAARLAQIVDPLEPVRLLIERAEVSVEGTLEVSGWAVSEAPVEHIRVYAGEQLIGEAQRGGERPDVADQHGRYPESGRSGFTLQRSLSDEEMQEKTVFVALSTSLGVRRVYHVPLVRPPQVRRARPAPVSELQCEEVFLSADGVLAVKGWAVCSSGIAEIAVELDGAMVGRATLAEPRPDVANQYPLVRTAERAGFCLVQRLAEPVSGRHTLRITADGEAGEQKTVSQIVRRRRRTCRRISRHGCNSP